MLTLYGTYALCLILVWSYAHDRFGTPKEYRFTTRPGPYWSSYAGYVACTFFLFLALCFLLSLPPLRQALLASALPDGLGADPQALRFALALPVPLAAALAISVLLPKFPVLRKWDEALLQRFREWANIPGEVHELAKCLQPTHLTLDAEHLRVLRDFIGREERDQDPDGLIEHLRGDTGLGFEQSQYRFTRVMHLFAQLKRLSGQPGYSRFFRQRAAQFERVEEDIWAFARRSKALLTLAREVRAHETNEAFAEVLAERREIYRLECAAAFKPLAELLAYALLRAETTDEAVATRLREIGFPSDVPLRPVFPINDLTSLAVVLLAAFLLVGGPFAPRLFPAERGGVPASGYEAVGVFIVSAHMLATLATVCLVQRAGAFGHAPGGKPPAFACACWAIVCGAASWLLCLGFTRAAGMTPQAPFVRPVTVLNGVIALVLSYLCAGGLERLVPARWLRLVEAAATAAAMAFAAWLVAWRAAPVADIPPDQLGRVYVVLVALPGAVGLLLGGFVPHIFRAARTMAVHRVSGASAPGGRGLPEPPLRAAAE